MTLGAAVFDFDRTLIRQESMAIFLRAMAGPAGYLSALAAASLTAARATPDRRMEVWRAELLRRTLAGKTVAQACSAAERIFARLDWIETTLAELARHQAEGRRVLVATGSLSCYVPALLALKGLTVDAILATEMAVADDILTGEMATPSCTWGEKARRVRDWLAANTGEVWGYGNMPHDEAMLALADHPTVVPG
jgi:phosphatidylglycerophosphatase C